MPAYNFSPFPVIKTDRLLLRQLLPSDENEIYIMRSDKRILEYLDIPAAKNLDDARKFIEKINTLIQNNESMYWGITLKNSPKLIGTICLWNISDEKLSADTGYVLRNEFQGKGYMQEALKKVIDFGFNTMMLEIIDAEVDPKNLSSIKLLEKLTFACTSKSDNTVIYSLAKSNN